MAAVSKLLFALKNLRMDKASKHINIWCLYNTIWVGRIAAIASGCKPDGLAYVGSSPTRPTKQVAVLNLWAYMPNARLITIGETSRAQLNMRILSLRNYIGVSVFKPKSSLRRLREGCRVVLKALGSIWIKWDSPVCLWVEMIYTTAVLTPIRHLIWRSMCVNMVSFISWTSRIYR